MASLNIGAVDFRLPESLGSLKVNEYFEGFAGAGLKADLSLSVERIDFCDFAEARGSEGPCAFRLKNDHWHIDRYTESGDGLWRVVVSNDFSAARVEINGALFSTYYFSPEDLISRDCGLLLLTLLLLANKGLVFHGSASVLGDEGIMCVGASGVGKSTIAHLLHNTGASVLSDERPIVRQVPVLPTEDGHASEFRVFGTPWPSSGGFAANQSAPLKRIYFLGHGRENRLIPLSRKDAARRIIQVVTIPWEDERLYDPCLQTVEALLANVPAAVLSFRPDEEVVNVIRQDLATEREIV